jgi:hypothetical protein
MKIKNGFLRAILNILSVIIWPPFAGMIILTGFFIYVIVAYQMPG